MPNSSAIPMEPFVNLREVIPRARKLEGAGTANEQLKLLKGGQNL